MHKSMLNTRGELQMHIRRNKLSMHIKPTNKYTSLKSKSGIVAR